MTQLHVSKQKAGFYFHKDGALIFPARLRDVIADFRESMTAPVEVKIRQTVSSLPGYSSHANNPDRLRDVETDVGTLTDSVLSVIGRRPPDRCV